MPSFMLKFCGIALFAAITCINAAPVNVTTAQGVASTTASTDDTVTADQAALNKRGGFFDSKGKWVDDGYYAWSRGDKKKPFVPWGGAKPPKEASGNKNTNKANSGKGKGNTSGSQNKPAKSPSASGSAYNGIGTYYFQGGNAGACGKWNSDSSYVVALQTSMYSGGSKCGQHIKIKNKSNGKSISALVADECPSCGNPLNVDLSRGAFFALGGTEQGGIIPIEWSF